MSFGVLPSTCKALRIGGKSWSNCTSTTAPITDTTRPCDAEAAAAAAAAADVGAVVAVVRPVINVVIKTKCFLILILISTKKIYYDY